MSGQYNLRNPAVKRLMKEAQELREPTEQYFAQPLEDNLFEWHFTIRGPADSEFEGGIYHGRITLPPEYPMKPPSIMLLTPNGRFETFKKICLSISGHHPESWQPSWSIRTALLAIIGFMPTHGNGAIGSLDYTADERRVLAKRSAEWKCPECGSIRLILKPVTDASKKTTAEAKQLATQINFQGEKEKNSGDRKKSVPDSSPAAAASPAAASPATADSPEGAGAAGSLPPSGTSSCPPGCLPTFPTVPLPFPPRGVGRPPPGSYASPTATAQSMPPFWANMPPTSSPAGTLPSGMPMYPWSPMMNPMMTQQMMMYMRQQQHQQQQQKQQQQQQQQQQPQEKLPHQMEGPKPQKGVVQPTPAQGESSAQILEAGSSTTSATTTTTVTSSSSPSEAPSSPPMRQQTSTASSSTPTTVTTTASSTTTASPPTGLRQRSAAAGVARAATVMRPPTPGAAAGAGVQYSTRGGESPAVLLLMAVLGLSIIGLILRRLYSVWSGDNFDNEF